MNTISFSHTHKHILFILSQEASSKEKCEPNTCRVLQPIRGVNTDESFSSAT